VTTEVYLVTCDVEASEPVRVRRAIVDLKVSRGGTDLREGIKAALSVQPRAIVVLTDGYTPWPEEPTEVPLVVCTTDQEGPKWAVNVRMKTPQNSHCGGPFCPCHAKRISTTLPTTLTS